MIVVKEPTYVGTKVLSNVEFYNYIVFVVQFTLKDDTFSLIPGNELKNLDCGRFIFRKVTVISEESSGIYLCECYDSDFRDLLEEL